MVAQSPSALPADTLKTRRGIIPGGATAVLGVQVAALAAASRISQGEELSASRRCP